MGDCGGNAMSMVERMAEEARKRVQEWINRSAGQHLRAMRKEAQK